MPRITSGGVSPVVGSQMQLGGKNIPEMSDEEIEAYLTTIRGARSASGGGGSGKKGTRRAGSNLNKGKGSDEVSMDDIG